MRLGTCQLTFLVLWYLPTTHAVDSGTLLMDKRVLRVKALHAQWKKEDADCIVEGEKTSLASKAEIFTLVTSPHFRF